MLLLAITAAVLVAGAGAQAASRRTQNVFLITTDGLRWQEVFTGAEALLMNSTNGGVADVAALRREFWRESAEARRQALMPFLWSEVATNGQLYGNRTRGSLAQVTNGKKFSYPGYSEFLTGAPDPGIDSNRKIPNPNTNVFEWLNTRSALHGRVAAVVNWDAIPWILNTGRSHLPVWSGFMLPPGSPDPIQIQPELQQLLADTTPLWDNMILDAFTARVASDYVKEASPRAFYVAFGETDEWAHEGRYDLYLRAAHHVDRFIARLWEEVQALPAYRNQTTFIITTDHGRGSGPRQWRDHGQNIEGAEDVWLAVIGPDTRSMGERINCDRITQSQVAATVAAFLGENFQDARPQAGPALREVLPQN